MSQKKIRDIAIIGGGVSGVVSFVEFVSSSSLSKLIKNIILIDRNRPGNCETYSPCSMELLMNTSVGMCSIIEDQPDHFYEWLLLNEHRWIKHKALFQKIERSSFMPRKVYGEYLVDTVKKFSEIAKNKGINVEWISEYALNIQVKKNKQLVQAENQKFLVDYVFVASGKIPVVQPSYSNLTQYDNYFSTPYKSSNDYYKIPKFGRVLIIGSRLSAIDSIRLLNEYSFEGEITIASRSGDSPSVRDEILLYEKINNDYIQYDNLTSLANQLIHLTSEQQEFSMNKTFDNKKSKHSSWQKHIVPFILRARCLWPRSDNHEKLFFKQVLNTNLNRFISACPVKVANELARLSKMDRLRIVLGIPRVAHDDKEKNFDVTFDDVTNNKYDYIINATNYGEISSLESISLYENSHKFSINKNYQLSHNPRVYIVGAAAEKNEIIINSTFTIVSQVKKIISILKEEL